MVTAATSPPLIQAPAKPPLSHAQRALAKLGLLRDLDFALHLPLRYEDETHITALRDARHGDDVQIEAVVTACDVQLRGKRQLVVTVRDSSDECTLRFFNFYPSHQKMLAVGQRLRIRGELKRSLLGLSMLHPGFKSADGDLPQALTAVYPTTAGLPQAYVRKAIWGALERCHRLGSLVDTVASGQGLDHLPRLVDALQLLHHPTPDVSVAALGDKSHPAWQRLIAEELLAQQLAQRVARQERAGMRAHVLARPSLRTLATPLSAQADISPTAQGQTNTAPSLGTPLRSRGVDTQSRGGISSEIAESTQSARENASSEIAESTRSDNGEGTCLTQKLLAILPFQLTNAQTRVGHEIAHDLTQSKPMNRLLQGDVGSGKTVVAALAAAQCIDAGHQCALMVPTEILAQQHFAKLVGWLEPLLAARGKSVAWLSGTQKAKERREMLALIESGQAALVVGTHAIIQSKVNFQSLALVIVDEQHRFGVAQRLALLGKTIGHAPHLLMMTATPIPRTLAMSYYADLDVSTIDELPPGRNPVVTKILNMQRRSEVIARIQDQLKLGRQVYWVCPLIEESEAVDLVNATQTHADLSSQLPQHSVALLHSKLGTPEKKSIMAAFTANQTQVLVSTTVIEVGVDVPNATLMVIEHAERFGLAQLHQLRGRVGRGAAASACVLLYAPNESGRLGESARLRLKAMVDTTDGFEIAKRDLEIRGPGEFMGARQSGTQMLRFADLSREIDQKWLQWAQQIAPDFLHTQAELAQQHLARWLPSGQAFLKA